jgi:hypothetical protein
MAKYGQQATPGNLDFYVKQSPALAVGAGTQATTRLWRKIMSCLRSGIVVFALCTGIAAAAAQTPQHSELRLTTAQKSAIYRAVDKEKAKVKAPPNVKASVGEQVPPSIELHMLPDDAVADAPAAKIYRYTLFRNEVLLVDPTTMRVVDVIRP